MHYGNIKNYDIADGEGVRVTRSAVDVQIVVKGVFNLKHGISAMEKNIQRKRKIN